MHFASSVAIVALSSLGVTYAAPFGNPKEDFARRQIAYQVVNVDGDSASSATPDIEVVTETVKSVTTATGSLAAPVTVTVTATPSNSPYTTVPPSSTPISRNAPPPGASFLPPPDSFSFFRRGLQAAGDPIHYARSLTPSAYSASLPTSVAPIAERGAYGWFTSSATPSATPSVRLGHPPSLIARQFGGWSSIAPDSSVPTPTASPIHPRGFEGWYNPSSTSSVHASFSSSLVARQFVRSGASVPVPSVPTSSSTPSTSTSIPAQTSDLVARDYHHPRSSNSAAPSSSVRPSLSAAPVLI